MKLFLAVIVFLVLMLCIGGVSAASTYSYVLHKTGENKIPMLTIYGSGNSKTTVQIREVVPMHGIRCFVPLVPK